MKFKKLFASVLAIALAATAIPATPAKADVISGQAAYLNTEVYKTVLPTTESQKFYLDPQGLSEVGANNTPSDVPTNAAGKIVGKSTMSAINLSSRPVKMEVKYELVVDAADMTVEPDITTSGTSIATTTATKPAVCLVVTAKNNSAKAVTAGATTGLATGDADLVTAVASGGATSAGKGIQTYEFEQGDFQVVTKNAIDANDKDALYNPGNYDYKRINDGASIVLEIGGACSKVGDYSAFTGADAKPLNLDMTFKFTKADGSSLGAIPYVPSAAIEWNGSGNSAYAGFFLPGNTDPDPGSVEISFDGGTSYAALDSSCYALYGTGWISVYYIKANGGTNPAHAQIKYSVGGTEYETVLY